MSAPDGKTREIDLAELSAALRGACDRLEALARKDERVSPPKTTITLARRIYCNRRRRDTAFGEHQDLLGEPAWDLLLDLYIADADQRAISVSSACIASGVPGTTALRWLGTLERRQLVQRRPDKGDRRKNYVELAPYGRALIHRALTAMLRR